MLFLTKLSKNHWNGGFISIADNLYVISGVETAECEMFSFVQKNIYNLPLVNYKRTNSGICNVNNEFIYALFGRNSDNSIERLNIKYGAQNEQKWELIKIITDQKSAISHVHCNSDLYLWVSTSINGYVNLYTLPLCKLARTIKVSSHNCSYSFLVSSPLPSIVIINDEDNSEINVFSINGRMITKHQLYFKLNSPIIFRDLNANEYLGYIGKDVITIHSLPILETLANINISPKLGIYTLFTSEDKKMLYCVNKSGSSVYVIRDEVKKNMRNASIAVLK